ncbi:hypothetical protein [Microbispora sp. NBRC 16548]|uniref:hypothetical protein n=1 Tax=Microbispora sp. NBRC 16548 TaxID=3030994 RepID=UPI0024A438D7|nr:hypothetical protein [Microbispora sp. NBRC 16548]GLX10425.1 hypothetical protein Misp03_73510 [Microbispora sp. NBRC 16548]
MTMPALFDLDNTLADRDEAFRRWAEEFADVHGLGDEAVERLVALDEHGYAWAGQEPASDHTVTDVTEAIGIPLSDAERR